MARMLSRVFRGSFIAGDNYFWYGYLYGRYTRACCPRYLQPEHFATLQARAGRVTVKTGLLHEVAEEYPDGYFTSMVLLDHMDWLSEEQVLCEWATFCAKLHPEKGRVLWRSFAEHQHLAPLAFLDLHPDAVANAEAAHPDRVGTYNSTHLATVPRGMALGPARAATTASTEAKSARAAPVGIPAGAPAAGAAASRHTSLYRVLPRLSGGVWLDLGGGLAHELRALAPSLADFDTVAIVVPTQTASAALRRTALELSLPNVRPCLSDVNSDPTTDELLRLYNLAEASVDLLSIAHGDGGLTDAQLPAALRLAARLLRPGGRLAVSSVSSATAPSAPRSERQPHGLRGELCECATEVGIYIYTYVYTYIHIYIYRERERHLDA